MNNGEYTNFKTWYNEILAAKAAEDKSKAYAYDITKEVPGKDGKVVVIKEIFSGDIGDDI